MNLRFLLIFCLFLGIYSPSLIAHQGCMQIPVSLADRVKESKYILEGQLITKTSFYDSEAKLIKTKYNFGITSSLKGNYTDKTISIIQDGGQIGMEVLEVSPSVDFAPNERGLLFIKTKRNYFELVALNQGIITYDQYGQKASDLFNSYKDISILKKTILGLANQTQESKIQDGNPFDKQHFYKASPSIKLFSPAVVPAGNYQNLTIKGLNFGSSNSGSALIEFPDANNAGAKYISANSSDIISWNDTQIVVRVPSGSGTGNFRVTNTGGSQLTSSTKLTVPFNLTCPTASGLQYLVRYKDANGTGGYTFQYSKIFNRNPSAKTCFERSLQNWRCSTLANFNIDRKKLATVDTCATDGINVITFDSAQKLPTGVLGLTYSRYDFCNNGSGYIVFVKEVDISFSYSTNFNFGPGLTSSSSQIDAQTVMTHELGHGHGLGHVIDNNNVMHFSVAYGINRRTVDTSGSIPGVKVMLSRKIGGCSGIKDMTKLSAGFCALLNPIAAFTTKDLLEGCSKLSVQFSDSSQNDPTSYKWDFDGDGKIDNTSQNPPKFNYNKPGKYSVKLVVANSTGKDSMTKTALVTVYDSLKSRPGVNRANCIGKIDTLGTVASSAKGGKSPYTYQWYENGVKYSRVERPTITTSSTSIYRLTVTDDIGCVGTDSVIIKALVNPTLNAGGTQDVCYNDAKTIGGKVKISGGQSPYSYKWMPSQLVNNDTIAMPLFGSTVNSYMKLIVKDKNGCMSNKDSLYIKIFKAPRADFNYGLNSDGKSVDFTTVSKDADTFYWTFGDGFDSKQANPTHQYFQIKPVRVLLKASNKCYSDTVSKWINLKTVGIEPNTNPLKITLLKTDNNYFVFTSDQIINTPLQLHIFDMNGKIIYANNIYSINQRINLDLAKGIYNIILLEGNKVIYRQSVLN